MLKKIQSKKLKALIILIATAIILFAVASVAWLVFYQTEIKPMVIKDNEKYITKKDHSLEDRATYYLYNSDELAEEFDLSVPDFLNFGDVGIQALTSTVYDGETGECLTDFAYYFGYIPKLFGKNSYRMRVDDCRNDKMTISDGEFSFDPNQNITVSALIEVDKDMNFVSGDRAAYDEHYDELKELFDSTKEFFGEDAFK